MKYLIAVLFLAVVCSPYCRAASVLMLSEGFPGSSSTFRQKLHDGANAAGLALVEVSGEQLASRLSSEPGSGSILLLPDATHFPADAKTALDDFLKRGNHLLAVSGPAFEHMVVPSNGKWLTKEQTKELQAAAPEHENADFTPPLLESISPPYKTYRTHAARAHLVPSGAPAPADTDVVCPISRGRGLSSDALHRYRFVPVVSVRDDTGAPRGTAAHFYLNTTTAYPGSVWGFVGYDQAFAEKNADRVVPLVVSMLQRMRSGIFFANAGSEFFGYTKGEPTNCGAYIVNLNPDPMKVKLTFVTTAEGRFVGTSTAEATIQPLRYGGVPGHPVLISGEAMKLDPGEYTIRTTLTVDGKPADEIAHQFHVVAYPKLTDSNTVSAKNGAFQLAGKDWHALGMNYWPRYSTGLETTDYWIHWLAPDQYDPEIIEQDLALAQQLKMNLLSIQYGAKTQARSLTDFLARCERRGIKVHISLPGLHPLSQDFRTANEFIKLAHLADDPAFFSYDLGWEVHVGYYADRAKFDRQWEEWVVDRYGSIESAEADWNYKTERVDGVLTGPKDDQLSKDGEWRTFVAAYRRFWDDEISKRYRQVRDNVRTLDKRHLMGARSGYGGTGSLWIVPRFPFDLTSGVKHLDYTSPEAYALGGNRLGFLKGGLITEYGRFVSGGKLVFWAEYGKSIWPACDAAEMERERQVYEYLLAMVRQSGGNGSAGWWWPGGLRRGETSDYGIVNPDGTPRPAALEFPKFAAAPSAQAKHSGEHVITIDRDKYVTGFAGIYTEHAADYVKAVESPVQVVLRTEGTGTTSADCPLTAVGNVPYNGHNPPKYLNAEFNWVKVNGREVRDGDVVEIARDKPVTIEVSVGNTGEAAWLPAGGSAQDGAVGLLVAKPGSDEVVARKPISEKTAYLGDALVPALQLPGLIQSETSCVLRMSAAGRAVFGEVVRVTLKPM